jgi:toxin ParE1/3/4
MSCYLISPSASRDLNAIAEYYLERNVEAGEKIFARFNQKCKNLVQFPKIGKSYTYIKPDLRGIPLNGYIIFYRVINDGVEILRVVSGRQNLEVLFSDNDDENDLYSGSQMSEVHLTPASCLLPPASNQDLCTSAD